MRPDGRHVEPTRLQVGSSGARSAVCGRLGFDPRSAIRRIFAVKRLNRRQL